MHLRRGADGAGCVIHAGAFVAPCVEKVHRRLKEKSGEESKPPPEPTVRWRRERRPYEERYQRGGIAPRAEKQEPSLDRCFVHARKYSRFGLTLGA